MNLEINQVIELIKNEKFEKAITNLNELIKNNKINLNYYHLRGISFLKLAKFKSAEEDFHSFLKFKSDFPDVYNNLAVLYFTIGENELAIKNFVKAISLKKNFELAINGLIKALTHEHSIEINNSNILNNHNKINEIKVKYSPDEFIEDDTIINFVDELIKNVKNYFINFAYKPTQIYRRDLRLLNCKRHDKIFKSHKVIPEFCFGCYKVQIEPDNIIDLIRLYILFDNINLSNIRKCMIELRPNLQGNYKGLIYCKSIDEAKSLQNKFRDHITKNFKTSMPVNIKRGCTEYGVEYPQYNNLEENIMNYKSDWKKYENLIDEKYPSLAFNEKLRPTIKGATLHDVLVIRNWIYFAKLNGDEKFKMLSSQDFESGFIKKKFNLKYS